jgi:hypothetical protein
MGWGNMRPPYSSKLNDNAGQSVCWWGAHKSYRRVPTQLLSRLSLAEPTGGVPEVWDHKLSPLYKDN